MKPKGSYHGNKVCDGRTHRRRDGHSYGPQPGRRGTKMHYGNSRSLPRWETTRKLCSLWYNYNLDYLLSSCYQHFLCLNHVYKSLTKHEQVSSMLSYPGLQVNKLLTIGCTNPNRSLIIALLLKLRISTQWLTNALFSFIMQSILSLVVHQQTIPNYLITVYGKKWFSSFPTSICFLHMHGTYFSSPTANRISYESMFPVLSTFGSI